MRVQDLDPITTSSSTDELIVTNPTNHKSFRQTLANFATSIKELFSTIANLEITSHFRVSGDTQVVDVAVSGDITSSGNITTSGNLSVSGDTALADTTVTGDVTITGDITQTGNADITGDVEVTGDLEVNGNITQRGSSYETHAEQVYTKNDKIILRDGAVSALGADDYAGLIAKHYDTQGNDGALVFDKNGEARVGDYTTIVYTVYSSDGTTFYTDAEMTQAATIPAGITPEATGETNEYTYSQLVDDTEPLMTRDEAGSMTDKAIIVWDEASKKAKSAPVPSAAKQVPISNADGSFGWGEVEQNIQGLFDILRPVGSTYTQYPKQKSPNELWGDYSTWEELNYGGAFFRAAGGNADAFDSNIKAITAVSGSTITIASHGAAVGTVIYDFTNDEARVVTAVSGNVLTLNSQFTSTENRNVLIGQNQATAKNNLWLNSASNKSGSANTTSGMSANSSHSHSFSNGGSAICVNTSGYDTRGGFADGNKWKNNNVQLSGIGSSSVAHTHSIYLGSDDTETRPSNYTYKVWVRVN